MFEKFFPDEYVASTYVIPFEKLPDQAFRGVVFHIDNTLVPHAAPADDRAKKALQTACGYRLCFLPDLKQSGGKGEDVQPGYRDKLYL